MIVDDDEAFHRAAASILGRAGYRTASCNRGDEALEAARRERPSLVIVDVRLPGLSGHEVVRDLKAEFGASLPVLLVSGVRTESFDRVGGLILGADDYLVKPFSPDELLARARGLIRRSEETPSAASKLTAAETEVLRLLAEGCDRDEIARRLDLDGDAVRAHIERIYAKVAT